MSEAAISARVLTSTRAQSIATLPLPMTATAAVSRSGSRFRKSGCPLYPPTKAAAPSAKRVVERGTHREHDGVIDLAQLVQAHVAPDLDIAVVAHARVLRR